VGGGARALPHYGRLGHLEPFSAQYQALFAVVDYTSEPMSVEFGIGHGFTAGSDALIMKLILMHNF
jgi:hypothetical protein